MSEMGEYWQEKRLKDQVKKLHSLNWGVDVIYGLCEELNFTVKKHSDVHFSLIRYDKVRLDYWPSTGVGLWFHKRQTNKSFHIKDIEAFLYKNFKQQ